MLSRRAVIAVALTAAVALAGCATVDVGTSTGDDPTAEPSVDGTESGTPIRSTSTAGTTATGGTTTLQGTALAPPGETLTVEVLYVVDGDTVVVERPNGSEATVRLVGIDAPETGGEVHPGEFGLPDTEPVRDCLRDVGRRAAEYARELLANRTVTLAFDPESDRRGYYGRLLGYVYVGADSLGYELVARGLARPYDAEFVARDDYERAEDRARAADRGLWGCDDS